MHRGRADRRDPGEPRLPALHLRLQQDRPDLHTGGGQDSARAALRRRQVHLAKLAFARDSARIKKKVAYVFYQTILYISFYLLTNYLILIISSLFIFL